MKVALLLSMFMSFTICVNVYANDLLQEVMERINYVKEHNDRSHFTINAGSDGQPINARRTKIHFIVTDSLGRKTGFESFFTTKRGSLRVKSYREIPNSSYGVDQATSIDPSVVPDDPESATLDFFPPILKDMYTIQFIGIDDCKYFADIHLTNQIGETHSMLNDGFYIIAGTTQQYSIYLDPTPGAPAPVIIKEVTFDVLRGDVNVAYKLEQLSDKKFKDELIKIIDRAEKLSIKCDKKKKKKDENCGNKKAAVNQLNSLIKRMEQALKKDAKDKKKKKFITDEAFNIIKSDAEILIKDLGGKVKPDKKEKKAKKKGN